MVFARRFARHALEQDDRTDPQFAFVVGCVVWGLLAWEGVGAPPPAPPAEIATDVEALAAWEVENPAPEGDAPVTADNVAMLLRQNPTIYDEIDRTYVESIVRAAAEKNVSGLSLNGISAGAKRSVTPVETAPSAHIAKTIHAPKRGKKSGPSSKAAAVS